MNQHRITSVLASSARDRPPRVRRVEFAAKGLYYENSPIGLARQLHGIDGVLDVAVDPPAGIAAITFDENRLSEETIMHLVSECGYDLTSHPAAGDAAGSPRVR